jgi:eukaryotic-like serine/threonine-protein kinase
MKPHQFTNIEEIFHAALDLSPGDVARFLDEKCGTDAELRKEVVALLEFETTPEHFLDGSPRALAADMFADGRSAEDLIGKSILHYKVIGLIGIGGMGEVYVAEDTKLGRKVALKLLPEAFANGRARMEMFVLEARAASALNHPNIITIHEIGEFAGSRFITTEFVNGKTLRSLIDTDELNITSTFEIAIQIASALEEAHAAGIVHRDIKPDNVMVRPNGLVKVLDFGVAKLMQPAAPVDGPRSDPHMPGLIVGTADYMSPEQASGGSTDPRSDIFSFGAVLYEMASGSKAFTGDGVRGTIAAINENDPLPISAIAPGVPDDLAAIVHRCLVKSVEDRYQNISDVLSALRTAKRQMDGDIAAGAKSIPQGASAGKHHRMTLALAGMLFIFLVALAGYGGYQYYVDRGEIRSVAVMPFVNESGDPGAEYLSDGMTENLIRSLSILSDISIRARSSVFTYKGKTLSPNTFGRELNVDAVVIGRLFQDGDDLKLTVELVETSTQDLLWSADYSRSLSGLVMMQRDVARDVAERLRPALTTNDRTRVAKSYQTNSEAQQLYLKGRFHWNKRTVRDLEKAAKYFAQAIDSDPNYALAYSGVADAYALMPLYGNFGPMEYLPKAKQHAMKALEMDPNLAEAHASLGYIISTHEYDWDGAEQEYQTALGLRPNYATARQWYAEHLAFRGRIDEALNEITHALEIDPFSLAINRMKGNILGFAKRFDEAVVQLNKTVDLYPEDPAVRFDLGEAYAAKGMYPEAIEQYLLGFKLDGRKSYEIRRYENAYKLKGWRGFWMEYLASLITLQAAIAEVDDEIYFHHEGLAYAYAATNNKEKAIEHLYKAYEARDPKMVTINSSGVYDILKDEPRYRELLGKVGLPK